jgi:hypothetical protein
MRKFLPIFSAFLFLSVSAGGQTKTPAQPPVAPLAKPDPIIGSAKVPLPPRESDFIAIFQNSRRQYIAARSIDGRRNARAAMQSTLHNFMGLSHTAEDWVGVFKDSKKNPLGSQSLAIEIAPGVTVSTSDNPAADGTYSTMVKQYSAMGKTINSLAIGDEVTFSADVIGSVISGDDDMVLHPQLIAKFKKLQKIDTGPAPVH